MNLAESRRNAEEEGTARWNKFKKVGTRVVWVFCGLIALGLVTYWTLDTTDSTTTVADSAAPKQAAPYPTRVPETAYAPNTSKSCPGVPMRTSLTTSFEEVNPHGCFSYWRVEDGRVILSGSITEKEVGPEGADLMGWTFYKARAKSGVAQFRYINCAGRKRDMAKVDCS